MLVLARLFPLKFSIYYQGILETLNEILPPEAASSSTQALSANIKPY